MLRRFLVLLVRVDRGDLRGGLFVPRRRHLDRAHLDDLLVGRLLALGGDVDRLHLAHFLATRDLVELLVGQLTCVVDRLFVFRCHDCLLILPNPPARNVREWLPI